MLVESVPNSVRKIKLAAGREIQDHILARIRQVGVFPTTQLRGRKGHLIDSAGVIVDPGVARREQFPDEPVIIHAHLLRDAVVLWPEGLFVGPSLMTPAEDGSYSTNVPDVDQLQPAPFEVYLEYGERALMLFDMAAQAQVPRFT